MPTQNSDLDTTWLVNTDNDTWTLAKGATITTDEEPGVFVDDDFTGNTIRLLGDVVTTGFAQVAVQVQGDNNKLRIGPDSLIDGSAVNVGVDISGLDTTITNAGVIKGINSAVSGYIGTTLHNSGRIDGGWSVYSQFDDFTVNNSGKIIGGDYGVRAEGDNSVVENLKGGLIKAETAVGFLDSEEATLTNAGKIVGDISGGTGETSITNKGMIVGDISLGDGVDRIDTRKGTIDGQIDGGDSGDTFLVGNKAIDIVELESGTGMDNVRSTVSFTLADNLETLTLLTKKTLTRPATAAAMSCEAILATTCFVVCTATIASMLVSTRS
jgi:hypothetical protein